VAETSLTDVAHSAAVSTLALAHVVGLVESSTASVATHVGLARVAGSSGRQKVDVRTSGKDLELRRDACEVEHSPVNEHLLETTCMKTALMLMYCLYVEVTNNDVYTGHIPLLRIWPNTMYTLSCGLPLKLSVFLTWYFFLAESRTLAGSPPR